MDFVNFLSSLAWKSLADQQFADAEKQSGKDQAENNEAMMECLKTAATNVFNEFIPENVTFRFSLTIYLTKTIRRSTLTLSRSTLGET